MKNSIRTSIMAAAVLALASLGTYAYGATVATSAVTIQAEITTSYAINCLTTSGGLTNVDFNAASPTAAQTVGLTCIYSTNDPAGVNIVLTTTSDLGATIGSTPVPLLLNSFVSVLDGATSIGAVPLKSGTGLQLNSSPLSVAGTNSASVAYNLKFAPDYTVQAASYTAGGITFTIGTAAI
jgi:hypothetical protein